MLVCPNIQAVTVEAGDGVVAIAHGHTLAYLGPSFPELGPQFAFVGPPNSTGFAGSTCHDAAMVTTETVTILFCDLVASTQRRARLGDDSFDAFTVRFMSALRAAIAVWGGHEVSSAGDGLMVVFRECR